jgi:protease-4
MSDSTVSGPQQYAVVAAAGVLALLVGVLLSPTIAGLADSGAQSDTTPDNAVAVVTVEGQVNQPLAEELETTLREIRANDSVEAVVIAIDTPGGAPAASERMYSAIQQTNEQMPVVASVGELSASGGYYAMLGAEDIYVHPTSQVGSVGLAASEPRQSPPIEGPSGPDKRGNNTIQALAQQDLLAEVFLESVMEERGDRIELSREQVATADIFLGIRAVENGFADKIGSLEVAIDDAAERAGLEEYTVVERDATPERGQFPIIVQAGDRLVAVNSDNPGYGDIKPVSAAMIYEPAVPQYETIQTFVDDENASRTGGERP